jgi:cell division septum initiation protein DivIVA
MPANETPQEELLLRDVKILFDENRRLKKVIEELQEQLKEK